MVTLHKFILTCLALLFITQCKNKQDIKTPLLGEWIYTNTIWYTSELTLQKDGIFTFHGQGCLGHKFSQGRWANNNGIIQLTSFDSFKQKEDAELKIPEEVVVEKKAKHKLNNAKMEFNFVDLKDSTQVIWPAPHDTVLVYFNNIQLQLKNDTLHCIGSACLPEEAKFYRARINADK
jgi:hypothetical protein